MCLDILCLVGVCQMEEKLSRLETEYDLQDKITAAYRKLTHDTSLSRSIRRSRDQCYRKAYNKVIIHVAFSGLMQTTGHSGVINVAFCRPFLNCTPAAYLIPYINL